MPGITGSAHARTRRGMTAWRHAASQEGTLHMTTAGTRPGTPDDAPDAVTPASPLITAGRWFEADGRPYIARMELPLSAEEMVAALYGEHPRLMPADLEADEGVWANAALVVVQDGLREIERIAVRIRQQERSPELAAPEWLAFCRRRVAEVTGDPGQWQAAKHRCPCGYATDDADAFDEHLGGTDGTEPEHFEVADGWTLPQVTQWQTAMAASPDE